MKTLAIECLDIWHPVSRESCDRYLLPDGGYDLLLEKQNAVGIFRH